MAIMSTDWPSANNTNLEIEDLSENPDESCAASFWKGRSGCRSSNSWARPLSLNKWPRSFATYGACGSVQIFISHRNLLGQTANEKVDVRPHSSNGAVKSNDRYEEVGGTGWTPWRRTRSATPSGRCETKAHSDIGIESRRLLQYWQWCAPVRTSCW